MRLIRVVTAIVTLISATAATSAAQTITIDDNRAPRVGVTIAYTGHSPDFEASVDSPLLGDLVRFRAGVGRGRWDSEFDSYANPIVTRMAASAIVFIRQPHLVKPYLGLGVARYIPRAVDLQAQTGMRLIAGMEGSGERWTIGVEVEIDLPRYGGSDRAVVQEQLYPTGRIGFAVRRKF
jgi:hypothetical protein